MTTSNKNTSLLVMDSNAPPPYLLRAPERNSSPFIFAAPHSGRYYPPDFRARSVLDTSGLQRSEDAFVDHLFEDVTKIGGALLVATHARSYLDLNRAANELDTTMFTPRLPPQKLNNSHRVKVGLGLIPRIIAEGVPIYKGPLPAREAAKRVDTVHTPYHRKLAQLLTDRLSQFGVAYLIDCHSMPSENRNRQFSKRGPDIVLGDSWGGACERELTSQAEQIFIDAGFRVRRNIPYSGGYSTVHYGNPAQNVHALQIEVNRAIYMDEARQTPLSDFQLVKDSLHSVCKILLERTQQRLNLQTIPLAAE